MNNPRTSVCIRSSSNALNDKGNISVMTRSVVTSTSVSGMDSPQYHGCPLGSWSSLVDDSS